MITSLSVIFVTHNIPHFLLQVYEGILIPSLNIILRLRQSKLHFIRFDMKNQSSHISLLFLFPKSIRFLGALTLKKAYSAFLQAEYALLCIP